MSPAPEDAEPMRGPGCLSRKPEELLDPADQILGAPRAVPRTRFGVERLERRVVGGLALGEDLGEHFGERGPRADDAVEAALVEAVAQRLADRDDRREARLPQQQSHLAEV